MNELMKHMAKFFFIGLAILIVGWTGWHTYSVLLSATGDYVASVYGLIVFEGGMLTWFFAFQRNAESMGQHAIALFGTVIGVVFVCTAFFLSMQVSPEEIARYGSIGRWLIVVATIETLVFVLLYELFNPKVWEEITEMINDAMLMAKAEKKASLMIEKESDELASEIAQNRKDRAFARVKISGIKPIPQKSGESPDQPSRPMGGLRPVMRPVGMETERPVVVERPNGENGHKGGEESPSR